MWTDQEIINLYDASLNMTLAELAKITQRTIAELKQLLMS